MATMDSTLFTNVRILDGSGTLPYTGSVLVQGNRIRTVGRSTAAISPAGATVIDGAGATLMPGMCEAHTHFSWNAAATLAGIQTMPLEEHVLWCAKTARRYLEAGWTSCVGAACAKPRLDVVTRNAINSGQIPGPRYLAASQEEAIRRVEPAHDERYKWFAPFGFVRYADDQGRTWGTPGAPASIPSIRDGVKQKAWFCGTPAEVIEGIKSIEAKYSGLEDFMIHWAEGLSSAEFKDQLRWFAKDVMPAFGAARIAAD